MVPKKPYYAFVLAWTLLLGWLQGRAIAGLIPGSPIGGSANNPVEFLVMFDEQKTGVKFDLKSTAKTDLNVGLDDRASLITGANGKKVPVLTYILGITVAPGVVEVKEPRTGTIEDLLRFIPAPGTGGPNADRVQFYSEVDSADKDIAADIGVPAPAKYKDENILAPPLVERGSEGSNAFSYRANADPAATGHITYLIHSDGAVPQPVSNGTKNAPKAGEDHSVQMSFDATTGTLSFTEAVINYANLKGDTSLDPAFASDPMLGASLQITDLKLIGPSGKGVLFADGTMTISQGGQTLLAATMPELLIDDTASSTFGHNIFAPLGISEIHTAQSPFLSSYDLFQNETTFTPELFGQSITPVTSMIESGQSFTTTVEDTSISFSTSTPEPSALMLFGLAFGLLGYRSRHRKQWVA
jgi:hypothetical protein